MKVIIFVSQRLKTKKCISFLCELWEKPPIFTPLTNPKIIVIRHERESLQFFSSHLFVTNITKICVIFIYQKCYNFFVQVSTSQLFFYFNSQLNCISSDQGCILLTSLSVISSKFIQKFAQKCQYFTLIDQSVPLITVTSLVY